MRSPLGSTYLRLAEIEGKLRERGDGLDVFGQRLLVEVQNLLAIFDPPAGDPAPTPSKSDVHEAMTRAMRASSHFDVFEGGGHDPTILDPKGDPTAATQARIREAQRGPIRSEEPTEVECPICGKNCPCCGGHGLVTRERASAFAKRKTKE